MNLEALRDEILDSIQSNKHSVAINAIKDCFTEQRDMPIYLFQSVECSKILKSAYDFINKNSEEHIAYKGMVYVSCDNQFYRLDIKNIYALYSLYMSDSKDLHIGMRIKQKNKWHLAKIWLNDNKTDFKLQSWSIKNLELR